MIETMTRPPETAPAQVPGAPTVALRVGEPRLRDSLHLTLAGRETAETDADVLVLHLARGQVVPPEAATFDGPLLVLSDDPATAADAHLAGVLPATASPAQIRAAVAALAEGLTIRLPGQPERTGFVPPEAASRPLLTPREVEVLALVGEGMSNKTIARRLGISAHTVKYHLEAVFAKLGVRSRAEAVTRGLRHGLIVV